MAGAWEGGAALAGAGQGESGGRTRGFGGGEQRVFQVLACGVCGVRAGDEEGRERSSGAGLRAGGRRWDLSDLPLLRMMSCGAGGAGASLPLLASDCKTLL